MAITTFESLIGGYSYTFPTVPGDQNFTSNFKRLNTRFTRTPGADGGVDEYGSGNAPRPPGQVTVKIYLDSLSPGSGRSGMQALRDSLNQMQSWGWGILTDSLNGVNRYALGRISVIDAPEDRHKNTDLFQPITITFECPEPYWLTQGGENLWNSQYNWNSAINWGGSGLTSITGSGTISVTNNGSAFTLGRFVAKVTGATAFNQLIVHRLVNSAVTDEVVVSYAFVQNDVIEIDSRQQWILVNGHDILYSAEFNHPAWLRAMPGSNSFEVKLDDAAAAMDATIRFLERYT